MNDEQLKQIFRNTKTIAVVGFSTNPTKPSSYVPGYLMAAGYRVIPVNPLTKEIQGMKAYPDLLSLPDKIDLVQIFRPSNDVPPVVDQAIRLGAKVVWMQEGVVNEPAAKKAQAAGLLVVSDMCMMKQHRRLMGG